MWKRGDIDIRYSTEEDIPTLMGFLFEPGVLQFFPMSDEKEIQDAAKVWISYHAYKCCYTAEKNGIICGMTNLYVSPFSKAKKQALFSIIVSEKFRNQGIGSHLIDHLEDVGKNDHGIDLLHLEVYETNPAKRLYERKGFQEYGRHPEFLMEPDGYKTKILMQKDI